MAISDAIIVLSDIIPSDDEIEVVSHIQRPPRRSKPVNSPKPQRAPLTVVNRDPLCSFSDCSSDAIQLISETKGINALMDYVHFFHDCKAGMCEKCFCYVCDVPVRECEEWWRHCKADDQSYHWRAEREMKKVKKVLRKLQ